MEKIKFTREDMISMIDMLNTMVTDKEYLSTHLPKSCPFWENQEIKEGCPYKSCSFCVSDNMIAFLDIIKDVFIKGKSPIDALTEESSAKAQTTKVRLYSNEDNLNDTLAWLALTDEQLRLLDYLIVNGFLTDGINYEECGELEFRTI